MPKGDQNSTVGKHQSRALPYSSADEEIVTAVVGGEPNALEILQAKLDRDLAVLRTPDAGNRLRALFESSPADLAAAANAAAKRRKR
jgi:hypothetical protein